MACATRSEHDPGVELHYARRAGGRGDLAEACGGDVDIRSREDNPVERIERIGLERQSNAFTDLEFPAQAQALRKSVRVAQPKHVGARRVAVREGRWRYEGVLIQE